MRCWLIVSPALSFFIYECQHKQLKPLRICSETTKIWLHLISDSFFIWFHFVSEVKLNITSDKNLQLGTESQKLVSKKVLTSLFQSTANAAIFKVKGVRRRTWRAWISSTLNTWRDLILHSAQQNMLSRKRDPKRSDGVELFFISIVLINFKTCFILLKGLTKMLWLQLVIRKTHKS